jgi:ABC-2 type transport system ATP-binding protein
MEPAIEISDLKVRFFAGNKEFHALRGIDLEVQPGQVFGFIGPNGAGKTTTMHILLGFIHATSGSARIFGKDVSHSISHQRIGYLSEHPDTYRFLTGRELLGLTGQLFDLKGSNLQSRVESVLDQMDLTEAADKRVATYSRGMLQRICLGQALVNDPDLLILDEPTSGLDPLARIRIRNVIADLKSRGKTVFFSSHELSEVETVCDHMAILSKGQIVKQGPVAELVPAGTQLEQYFLEVIS